MANRTDKEAAAIRGTNPQHLVEKITRSKIYNSMFWKEHCFAVDAETIVDRCMDLKAVGGTFGGARNPSNFLCLLLKILQIQPADEVITEYILQEDSKYLRILGAFYLRLTGKPDKVYRYIEPLFNDFRKVRHLTAAGGYELSHVDELAEAMLLTDHLFDIAMPRLPKRAELEAAIGVRMSGLDDTDLAQLEAEAAADHAAVEAAVEEAAGGGGGGALPGPPAGEAPAERERLRLKEGAQRDEGERRRERRREEPRGGRERERHRDGAGRREERGEERERDGRRERERGRERGYEREADRERSYERERPRAHERDREREGRGGQVRERERRSERERERERDSKRLRRGEGEAASVEESNRMRAQLGLAPLR